MGEQDKPNRADIWVGEGAATFSDYTPPTNKLAGFQTVLGVNGRYVSVTRGNDEVQILDPAKSREIMEILRRYDSNGVQPSERAILHNIAEDALDNGRLDQSVTWMPKPGRIR